MLAVNYRNKNIAMSIKMNSISIFFLLIIFLLRKVPHTKNDPSHLITFFPLKSKSQV